MTYIQPWVLELVFEYVSISDLASLACVSREVNRLVIPKLYRSVRFHCHGRIELEDALLRKLDVFSDPQFVNLMHTQRVYVTGSWYNTYDDIESGLALHRLMSPAVRMFNSIIRSSIVRMPSLKHFVWDLQIPLSQPLVTSIMHRPNIELIQLRMGTDSTPNPFFHPANDLDKPVNVRALRFVQVDNESILRSMQPAVFKAANLRELRIWADEDSGLVLTTLLANSDGKCPFRLRTLDLRGFAGLGMPPCSFWDTIKAENIRDLTVVFTGELHLNECQSFWRASLDARLRPTRLSTNLSFPGFSEFLSSFSGLEAFCCMTPMPCPVEPLPCLIQALQRQHSETLKILSLTPGECPVEQTVSLAVAKALCAQFPSMEELRIGLEQPDPQVVQAALCNPILRVLHVCHSSPLNEADKTVLHQAVLQHLETRVSALKYVAFDNDLVYQTFKTPPKLRTRGPIAFVTDSALLSEQIFDWAEA